MPRTTDDGARFQKRFLMLINAVSSATPALVVLYLVELLKLTPEELRGFLGFLVAAVVLSVPVGTPTLMRLSAGARRYLDARAAGAVDRETLEEGFRCVVNLPARQFVAGALLLLGPSTFIGVGMALCFDTFGAWDLAVLMTAALGITPLSALIQAYVVKHWLRPLRARLAAELPDADAQERLTRRIPIRRKLQLAIVTTAAAPVLFAAFYAHHSSVSSLERRAAIEQERLLAGLRAGYDPAAPEWLATRRAALRELGIAAELQWLELAQGGADGGLDAREAAWVRSTALREGEGAVLESRHVFRFWKPAGTGRALVVRESRDAIATASASSPWVLASAVGLCLAFALGMAFLAARDIGEATEMMGAEARRIAGGDLRDAQPFVAEDELGELGRAFAEMRLGLHATVQRVSEAADHVERQSEGIVAAMGEVTQGTEREAHGARESSTSMERINAQIGELSAACEGLTGIVEEAGSSLLELSAAGQQLSDNAGVLAGKVQDSASAAEQMGQSVAAVGEGGDALRAAAEDTSSSMEEMAASLAQVNQTVQQSSKLSKHVVASADAGSERVRETIEGMASIRAATSAAHEAVTGLGRRTGEIGSILTVIESVADETNLLALNAAIIAAQSGEHGRGFAVVAREIQELADRVLRSTKEIGAVIGAVQHETAGAVSAMEEGAREVSRGVVLAEQAGRSLEEINEATRDSGQRMDQILTAVDEQTRAARHVVSLMGVVLEGAEGIHRASDEHRRGSRLLLGATSEMREIAQQVHATTREHAAGAARIRTNVEGVSEQAAAIQRSVDAQGESGRQMGRFLEASTRTTGETLAAVERAVAAAGALEAQARTLREAVADFHL